MQSVQAIHVKDRRGGFSHLPQDIGGIHPDRARAAVGQLHHQKGNAVQPLEPPSGKQPTKQRMRRRRHPHVAGQYSTKMLQSVGVTPGTGKTHLATGLAIRACQAGHRVLFATASQWVARLADAHHAGRLQTELVRLGRYPLLVIDLCRHRNYAEARAA
jgi:hypothetical protein